MSFFAVALAFLSFGCVLFVLHCRFLVFGCVIIGFALFVFEDFGCFHLFCLVYRTNTHKLHKAERPPTWREGSLLQI